MSENTIGRLQICEDTRALMAAYEEKLAEKREAAARRAEARKKLSAKRDLRSSLQQGQAAEGAVGGYLGTIENIELLKGAGHDVVDGLAAVGGVASGGTLGAVSAGASLANTAARQYSQSGLFGILPGSTNTAALSGLDVAGTGINVGAIGSALPSAAGATATAVGVGTRVGGGAVYVAGAVTRGGIRTDVPQFGNVLNLPSDQLRSLAQRVREGYQPGWLERFNNISSEGVASSLERVADARDAQARAGQQMQGLPDRSGTLEEAEQEYRQADEEVRAADAELAALAEKLEDARLGLCVLPK